MKPKSENAFDGLRLLAATAVLLSHSFVLTGHDADEPIRIMSGGTMELGEIAVYVFFAMSGYLVSTSWLGDPHIPRFLWRRCLRIFPALILVIVASFLLGAHWSTLGVADYFTRRDGWFYLAKIFIYPTQYGLPNVFHNNPVPDVVNGSLWTLRLEFALYLVVATLGWMGWLRQDICWLIVGACLVVGVCFAQMSNLQNINFAHQIMVFLLNTIAFFIGAAYAGPVFNKVSVLRTLAVMTALAAPLLFIGAIKFYVVLVLSFLVLFIAKTIACNLSRLGDYSYGVYLWAFPVQQAVVAMNTGITPLKLFVVAGGVTLMAAIVSWHMVEKPLLALKPQRPTES